MFTEGAIKSVEMKKNDLLFEILLYVKLIQVNLSDHLSTLVLQFIEGTIKKIKI